jgi:hypothetical protein
LELSDWKEWQSYNASSPLLSLFHSVVRMLGSAIKVRGRKRLRLLYYIVRIITTRLRTILSDLVYMKLTMDPTNNIEKETTSLFKKSNILEEVAKKLIHHSSAPPRLYGLPKIHKKDVPLRRIVNCIACPAYALAKYLAGLLSPLVGQSNRHIKILGGVCSRIKMYQLPRRTYFSEF